MNEASIENALTFTVDNTKEIAHKERVFVDTLDMLEVRANGWKQMGLFLSADARDINITLCIIGRGGSTVGA